MDKLHKRHLHLLEGSQGLRAKSDDTTLYIAITTVSISMRFHIRWPLILMDITMDENHVGYKLI